MTARTIETPFRSSIKGPPMGRFGTPHIEVIAIETLKRSSRNARTHSKKQIEQIVSSIRRFGWTFPILIDENGNIIAGHGRLEAAIYLGLKGVPVIAVRHLSDTETLN